ncbi:MAG: DUF1643 domain-containing protein [Candidatus Thiodiazotropha sp. (ex Rostrolucina anterorostrata)]|nr:DUF1643 domain-containing protein [Candidatus Thiodiazotropha sp. (ex Rostrolucina anterorostrata)]
MQQRLLLEADIGAVLSPDRDYRYSLWRIWQPDDPYALFIGLNPSTADEYENDPTIRRCIRFAKDWGFGGLYMANLFAIRATKPKIMKAHHAPIGIKLVSDHRNILKVSKASSSLRRATLVNDIDLACADRRKCCPAPRYPWAYHLCRNTLLPQQD